MLVGMNKRFPSLRSRSNFIKIGTSHGVCKFIYYTSIKFAPVITPIRQNCVVCDKVFEGFYEISSESDLSYKPDKAVAS